jgi:HrpA-like RNA helicase
MEYLGKKRKVEFDGGFSSISMNNNFGVKGLNPYNLKEFSANYHSLLEIRRKLPAWEAKKQLEKLLKEHQTIIIQGETGSGKTTQIPQFLVELGYTK